MLRLSLRQWVQLAIIGISTCITASCDSLRAGGVYDFREAFSCSVEIIVPEGDHSRLLSRRYDFVLGDNTVRIVDVDPGNAGGILAVVDVSSRARVGGVEIVVNRVDMSDRSGFSILSLASGFLLGPVGSSRTYSFHFLDDRRFLLVDETGRVMLCEKNRG